MKIFKKLLWIAFLIGFIHGAINKIRYFHEVGKVIDKQVQMAGLEYEFLQWFWDAMYDDDVTLDEFRETFQEKMSYIEAVRQL